MLSQQNTEEIQPQATWRCNTSSICMIYTHLPECIVIIVDLFYDFIRWDSLRYDRTWRCERRRGWHAGEGHTGWIHTALCALPHEHNIALSWHWCAAVPSDVIMMSCAPTCWRSELNTTFCNYCQTTEKKWSMSWGQQRGNKALLQLIKVEAVEILKY